jgi:glycosyltransferase involved in cell wall biosynthesis
MEERGRRRRYGPEVRRVLRAFRMEDYAAAAEFVNRSPARVVSLQHEYGIFGGRTGGYVLKFLGRLAKPVVTTLHTVLAEPKPKQLEVLQAVCGASAAVAAQTKKAAEFLTDIYGVPTAKVHVIPHGAPDVPFADPALFKRSIGTEGRPVILTSGLIDPHKGIHVVVRAMAAVKARFPSSLFIVLGVTHPTIKKLYGETYRQSLQKLVGRLGLRENVRFVKRFVTLPELLTYLRAADVYISPYLNEDQISSGTLAYAVASGRATISTPYWYARELLAEGRGILVPFRDSDAVAAAITGLLADDDARLAIARRAYAYGRGMTWAKAAASYETLFRSAATATALPASGPASYGRNVPGARIVGANSPGAAASGPGPTEGNG